MGFVLAFDIMRGFFLGTGLITELILLLPLAGAAFFWVSLIRRSRQFGYRSTRAYLRAAPRTDIEKRDATDLAFKGVVWCLMGMFLPPFVLVGLIPLYYGGRKLAYATMGLGLIDDPGM